MERHELSVGDKVLFGTGRGEKTLGEIVKLNPKKAKVKTLEIRGTKRTSQLGAVWTVPYGMLSKAPSEAKPQQKVDPELRHVRDYSRKATGFKKGDRVWFVGKASKKIVGTVLRANKRTVSVEPDDGRTRYWRVPASMLFREGEQPKVPEAPKAPKNRSEAEILSDLLDVEYMLSPENLSCDGELPAYRVRQSYSRLMAKKRKLIKELGRTPTDDEIWGQPPQRKGA